ncbi:transcriptional regulator [Microvirga terrestris]|uniref:Transcriptional regulator n=1 Tax=Microvirga terrestris TaxID=2791024 RepID=A0ABS0HUJ4_9HYPH|nr:transcriptional regulator [Microvirga terrestris]MBF9197164.1 transcriptional regulator [Microvirga terrestris]
MPDWPKIAFLDFEASSLGKEGYPIEVAWVLSSGEEESHLIRPDRTWTDWDPKAETVHGLSRDRLHAEGAPVADVAQRMMSALAGYDLFATAPSWDGKWLSRLLRAAGLPRHALRLQDTEAVHRQTILEALLEMGLPAELHDAIMKNVLSQAQRKDDELGPAEHRALADARREQRLWLDIHRCTREIASNLVNAADQAAGSK